MSETAPRTPLPPVSGSMEVQADINADDYNAFLAHAVARASSAAARFRFGWLVIAWGALAVLFTWLYTATPWAPSYILSCGIGIVLGTVLLHWVNRLQQAGLAPEEGGYLLGPRTFLLEEAGLRARAEPAGRFEIWVSWAAIRAVEETPEHIFVYIDRGAALIVPKRAFASPEEGASFALALKQGQALAMGSSKA